MGNATFTGRENWDFSGEIVGLLCRKPVKIWASLRLLPPRPLIGIPRKTLCLLPGNPVFG